VCPEDCITFVRLSEIAADPALLEQVRSEVGETGAAALAKGTGTALIKDETVCIRCGLCAERCPAGTITMEQFLIVDPAHV
jgi:NAD-dependent dihydropyrimidine dehydrogenase PreA subunit